MSQRAIMKILSKISLVLALAVSFADGAQAESVAFKSTGETIEVDAEGKPSDARIRRVDPEEVDEKFWGIKLEDIQVELVRTK